MHGSALLIYKNAHDARTACDLVNGVQVESSNTVLWVRKPGTKNWAKGKGKGARMLVRKGFVTCDSRPEIMEVSN